MNSCENRFELIVDLCEISAVLKDMRLMYLLALEYDFVPIEGTDGIKNIIGDVNEELLSKLLSRYQGRSANYMIDEIITLIEKI